MLTEQQYREAQEIVDAWKKQHRKPRQGDYYEGINDRNAINPGTGLTWFEQYQSDLARWCNHKAIFYSTEFKDYK